VRQFVYHLRIGICAGTAGLLKPFRTFITFREHERYLTCDVRTFFGSNRTEESAFGRNEAVAIEAVYGPKNGLSYSAAGGGFCPEMDFSRPCPDVG
jgi:hypothetical protein